jgi:5'-phosphate synthase pdxT subunit
MDVAVRRNAYGRQVDSFEADLDVSGFDEPFSAVFIRAPLIERAGDDVEVLATLDERPVLVRQGRLLGSSFHPEMTGDNRVHSMFVEMVSE